MDLQFFLPSLHGSVGKRLRDFLKRGKDRVFSHKMNRYLQGDCTLKPAFSGGFQGFK
jgi:hypothetical protein